MNIKDIDWERVAELIRNTSSTMDETAAAFIRVGDVLTALSITLKDLIEEGGEEE